MAETPAGAAERVLSAWLARVRSRSRAVVVASAIGSLVAAVYAATGLGIDTETDDLFDADLPWRRAMDAYLEAFPELGHTLLVVLEAPAGSLADSARERLARRLSEREELFLAVHSPGGGEYFERHGLLLLDTGELEALEERIRRYAPWLRRLETSPTLPGLAAVLDSTLRREGYRRELELAPLLGGLAETFRRQAARQPFLFPWADLLRGRPASAGDRRRFLVLTPRLAYDRARPGRAAMTAVREASAALGLEEEGVRLRLTGRVAMQDEELLSAARGGATAGALALVMVGGLLFVGLGAGRLVVATLATLLAGLSGTAAFAALTVGHLNLISVAFAVLYIGLGVDYAIHLSLRYRELREREGREHGGALRDAVGDVGPSLSLSAATTAVAFYAFAFGDFRGMAELGIISGSGMFVSLLVTLTLLPALLERTPLPPPGRLRPLRTPALFARIASLPAAHPRPILAASLVVGGVSAVLLPAARFDPNPLLLRDPDSESVSTYLELLEDESASPLTLALLRPTAAAADRAADSARTLPAVQSARVLGDFVPRSQAAKLEVLERIRAALGPPPDTAAGRPRTSAVAGRAAGTVGARSGGGPDGAARTDGGGGSRGPPSDAAATLAAVGRIRGAVVDFLPWADSTEALRARVLLWEMDRWRRTVELWPVEGRVPLLADLERSLVGTLPAALRSLREGLRAGPVTRDDLPADLVRRWVSAGGLHRVEIAPERNLARPEALEDFVRSVRARFPDVTGSSVVQYQAGRVAVRSFRNALVLVVLGTTAVLLLALRSWRDTALVLAPLLLAGLATAGASTLFGIPFNFANIIALPLLLGVGVDNGIHMVHRSRAGGLGEGGLLRSSTSRAVVVSFLTTILSFGNLAFSAHRGMAGMGRLLAIGMVAALAATLLLLPALLELRSRREDGTAPTRSTGGTGRGRPAVRRRPTGRADPSPQTPNRSR